MAYNILILGASYGSLLGTKLLMAGHDVTLVCRRKTAELINAEGTVVRIKLKDEEEHRSIHSSDLPGNLTACTPQDVVASGYDMVGLAMQEPQYAHHTLRTLMIRIAAERLPCLSIMNMPPLTFLKRIPDLDTTGLGESYTDPTVWDRFDPDMMTLCSPDPQAFRPPDEAANVLHVGLPTNFKAAAFADAKANAILKQLEDDIAAVRLDIDQAIPCGLILNELTSNSFKHAFTDRAGGELSILLKILPETGALHLCVADDGIGVPPDLFEQHRGSLGLQLVQDLVRQLDGKLTIVPDAGAHFEITFTPKIQLNGAPQCPA